MSPSILAIDTASPLCSAAVGRESIDAFLVSRESRRHADEVLPMIEQVLKTSALTLSDLAAIAIVAGPGSFTGLRIGTAVAQGLAFGCDLPVVPVSSLAMMARHARHELDMPLIAACVMHAREDEYYFALYRDHNSDAPLAVIQDCMVSLTYLEQELGNIIAQFARSGEEVLLVGSDWSGEAMINVPGKRASAYSTIPDARTLWSVAVQLFSSGEAVDAADATPVYLKDDMAYRTVKES